MNRIIIPTALFIAVVALFYVYDKTGWPFSRYSGGIIIPDKCIVRVDGKNRDPSEINEFRKLFKSLRNSKKGMYDQPSIEIKVIVSGETEPRTYSVWLPDKFVYEGHFTGAWTERMAHDYSEGFRLDRKTAEFLQRQTE